MTGTSGSFLAGSVSEKGGDKPSSEAKFYFEIGELRDIFSEDWNQIFPRLLGRAVQKNMEDNSRFFCLGRK